MKKYIFALFIGGLCCGEQILAQDLKSNLVFDMQVELGPLQVAGPAWLNHTVGIGVGSFPAAGKVAYRIYAVE